MTRLAIGLAAVCVTGVALAQPAGLGESAKRLIGTWEFSNADRDRICTATFKSDPTPFGFKIEFDSNCPNLFPLVREIAGWKFPENDLLYMVDSRGRTIVEFSEVEAGIFEAPTPGVGVLFLQNAAAAGAPPRPPEQLAGDWSIVRKAGAPVCSLTLAMTACERASSCGASRNGVSIVTRSCWCLRAEIRGASKKSTIRHGGACRRALTKSPSCGSSSQINRRLLKLAWPSLPTTMWSCTAMPRGRATSMIVCVIWMSACDGVGSPDG